MARRPIAPGEAGFSLADSLIAVAVLSIGIIGIVQVIPYTAKAQVQARTATASNVLALSKMDELRGAGYSAIGATGSGDFSSLIGTANFTGLGNYSWKYTSSEEISGILKKVELAVIVSGRSDSYVFYVADMEDEVP